MPSLHGESLCSKTDVPGLLPFGAVEMAQQLTVLTALQKTHVQSVLHPHQELTTACNANSRGPNPSGLLGHLYTHVYTYTETCII